VWKVSSTLLTEDLLPLVLGSLAVRVLPNIYDYDDKYLLVSLFLAFYSMKELCPMSLKCSPIAVPDYKYRGAVKKYQSQSQLAYEDHVREENLLKMVKTC